jgi:bifunctional UDP-N-acetylglucosamine pyrophosphorylase/glucosamine-1-phosphate N-acetyltransferase
LGSQLPKILTPLTANDSVWSVLHTKLAPLVDHIHVVLSPDGAALFPQTDGVSTSIQFEPTGMGDAIFQAHDAWSGYEWLLVVWGDQVFVSGNTLSRALAARSAAHQMVLPLTRMAEPYVEYVLEGGCLLRVLQTREGDATTPYGFSDVGTFLLSVAGLKPAWQAYRATTPAGAATGEINFLPFLPFLSDRGWKVTPLEVADVTEARGINTPDDLAFFQNLYEKRP